MTSSFASTVPNAWHQFTGASETNASRTASGSLPGYVVIGSALPVAGLNHDS